ncbi:PfkB family carbohydrate kinase [Leifsonia sp. F6_8S_P_1B]|uniref:PfkB family carbohydrate kinase n=1 Tax=Leifsonia williamsii TaxID=3035919 RepID=A0ABT8KBC4_9MICO|nr:PfkB family carbohydrate kinase [Leifsonia williamsii]MDN4613787.1 PfkB family carbohydrate kinase [Leifsonia williamsii]
MTIHTLGLTPALDVVYVLDHVEPGRIHRPPVVLKSAGGKSLNVARALALLERPVRAIVPLGGHVGALVSDLLADAGVAADVIPTGAETRLCVTACDTGAGRLTEFYELVHEVGLPPERLTAELGERLSAVRPGEWLTVSGAVPRDLDPAALAGLLAEARGRGVRVALDTHGPALGALLRLAPPDLVKVNRAEAAELTGAGSAIEGARALVALGARVAVVTDGEAGASAATADGHEVAQPPVAEPGLFPVGSGDCFLAGLVAGLADDEHDTAERLEAALALAARVAAANALRPGAAVF